MSELSRNEIERRLHELPECLHDLYLNDPIIHNTWCAYAHGAIPDYNTALCQLIIAQSKAKSCMFYQLMEIHKKRTFTVIVPKGEFSDKMVVDEFLNVKKS